MLGTGVYMADGKILILKYTILHSYENKAPDLKTHTRNKINVKRRRMVYFLTVNNSSYISY